MWTWTIGSGGLIGSAINAQSRKPFTGPSIPWTEPEAAEQALVRGLDDFAAAVSGEPWSIVWAAGAGTTASPAEVFEPEIRTFAFFLDQLRLRAPSGPGVFGLISSAGGIHAGSPHPPFTAATAPAPISAYGRAKLEQEQLLARVLGDKVPSIIFRVSNAYGPGQNLDKLQGLVSRLAVCTYRHEPVHLFVPVTTVRDYIFTSDIADRVHMWLEAPPAPEQDPRTVVIASGTGTSIAQLVRIAGDVSHRRIPLAMGSHPSSKNQPADSRFIPTPLPSNYSPVATSMPVGIRTVFDDISSRLAQASA